jgi:hypothetical protein
VSQSGNQSPISLQEWIPPRLNTCQNSTPYLKPIGFLLQGAQNASTSTICCSVIVLAKSSGIKDRRLRCRETISEGLKRRSVVASVNTVTRCGVSSATMPTTIPSVFVCRRQT